MRNYHRSISAALFLLALAGPLLADPPPKFTRNATVHDPSVIRAGDRFYVFGSHGASAWTEDLMNWTQVAVGVNSGNPPHFSTFQSELSELRSWTNATTLWAADVIQLEDGKFYYYYNVWTDFNSYRSYMGLAVADAVEGPYRDLGEILKGGAGVAGFDPSIHPNTIDPALFRDADQVLWMVYGSYSGGIYILKMDEQTGFPQPGQDWGKRLLGGSHAQIEGPFIEYNADTGYYYLFVSYGGLGAADGYNMRVFRSENPDGPYYDPRGTDMSTTAVNSSRASIAPHGLKLAGNWQFLPVEGEGATSTVGYLSPGHNSVIRDPASGKWFNFFHTRFVGRGEEHEVRVHQLYFNEDGWPVMAPRRYAGESQRSFTAAQLAGSYKVISHGKEVSGEVKTSTVVGLQQNGGLAGADGSWSLVDDRYVRITLGGVAYRGVACELWDEDNKQWVKGFTAISSDGVALWGSEVATTDRSGDLAPPDLEPIEDRTIRMGESLSLALNYREAGTDLVLVYKVLEGPEGLSIDEDLGALEWEPLASQMGKTHNIRIQVYDLLQPDLADEVAFSVYVGGGYESSLSELGFASAPSGGILDSAGQSTGLTARLSGTGGEFGSSDPNLTLDLPNKRLLLASTQSDFNGQQNVSQASAVGLKLSSLGFTGSQDFAVTAEFEPIVGLENIDQVGVFVGSSATTLTRAGVIQMSEPEGLGVHTQSGTDSGATFLPGAVDLSDGLSVTIARSGGVWSHLVDGASVSPQAPNADFLDTQSDLTVGVFAITPLNGVSKSIAVKSLRVTVSADALRMTRIEEWRTEHFGATPGPGLSGDSDDPDGDGRSNLLEYALGSDPRRIDVPPHAALEIIDGSLWWTFNRIDDPALTYRVYASPSLDGSGSEMIWSSAAGGNEAGPVQVEAPLPSGADFQWFLRLEVDSVE